MQQVQVSCLLSVPFQLKTTCLSKHAQTNAKLESIYIESNENIKISFHPQKVSTFLHYNISNSYAQSSKKYQKGVLTARFMGYIPP